MIERQFEDSMKAIQEMHADKFPTKEQNALLLKQLSNLALTDTISKVYESVDDMGEPLQLIGFSDNTIFVSFAFVEKEFSIGYYLQNVDANATWSYVGVTKSKDGIAYSAPMNEAVGGYVLLILLD